MRSGAEVSSAKETEMKKVITMIFALFLLASFSLAAQDTMKSGQYEGRDLNEGCEHHGQNQR